MSRSETTDIDYLIVGQGLAGTVLAWHFLLYLPQLRIRVLNDASLPTSSGAAAGIFNPLTGKKLVKTWKADTLFPYAKEFYCRIEKILNTSFRHELNVYRPYRSIAEQNDYTVQTIEQQMEAYVVENTETLNRYTNAIQAPFGGLEVQQAGWVDLPTFLQKSRAYLVERGIYQETYFVEDDLSFSDDRVEWQGLSSKKVIFCRGVYDRSSKYFGWLPFNPVKGQVLTASIPNLPTTHLLNQGVFVLPTHEQMFRVGATYSWHDLDWECTADGRNYLETKLNPLLRVPYQVEEQRAGIRPATKDRRPFLGMHPRYSSLMVFNGLGSKGVTLSPYFAREFVHYVSQNLLLNPEVNIERYFSLYC